MYCLATKRTKKRVEENANVNFFDRQLGVHWSCYVLLFTDLVNFGQSRLSGLSLVAFINYPLNRTFRQLVTDTGLIVWQYTIRRRQYDRLSQQQLIFLFVFCVQPSRSRWQLIFFITALMFGGGTMAYVILGTSREQQWTTDGDVNTPSVNTDTNENAPLISDSVSNSRTDGAMSDVVS